MDLSDIRNLYAYNLWASQRLFSALTKISDEEFSAPLESSFPSVRKTVFHILAAEWIWLMRWTGRSPLAAKPDPSLASHVWTPPAGLPAPKDLTSVADHKKFADSLERERQQFLDSLDERALHADVNFTDMAGTPYSEPLVQLLQHVVNHGTYHRGQVMTMLRQLGAETVALDMLYFFRETNVTK